MVKTPTLSVFQLAQRLSRLPFITRDVTRLCDVDRAFTVGRQSAERHLRIHHPLGNELARRVEDLYPPAQVFTDVDAAGSIDANAARVSHHSRPDSFATELENHTRKPASLFTL